MQPVLRLFTTVALALGLCAPAFAQVALPDAVETTPLSIDAFSTGTLDRSEGAMPPTLWIGSDAETLGFLLDAAPARPLLPSLGEALRRVLLTPGAGPDGAPASLGGKKLYALARAGFGEDARTIASLSNAARNDPWVGQALAVADLLSGADNAACARGENLASGREAIFWVKLRVFCYATSGERDAADLTLGILRERDALSGTDAELLSALVTGRVLQTASAPENALHFAIYKRLNIPLSPYQLTKADAGVLKAVAWSQGIDTPTRVAAAEHAAAAGAMRGPELAALFQSFSLELTEIGAAVEIARTRPDDPLTDAILYQAVMAMNAPEFLRDKAALIARALAVADSFARAHALSLLYANDTKDLEGALLPGEESRRFAMARMAVGDSQGAGRWLFAMIDGGDMSAMNEADAMAFIELTNLLSVLDPASAAIVADAAGVSIVPPRSAGIGHYGSGLVSEGLALARIVDAAFDAAFDDGIGQAALAALAASSTPFMGAESVVDVVVRQSLRAAGLEDVRRRMAFELAWMASFPDRLAHEAALPPAGEEADGESAVQTQTDAEYDGFTPRLKPPRKGP